MTPANVARVHSAVPTPKIKQSYLAGAGVSGGLLAGAAIVFISLVGLVSLALWPQPRDSVGELISELDTARTGVTSAGSAETPSSSPPSAPETTTAGPGRAPAGANDGGQSAGKGGDADKVGKTGKGGTESAVVPPATTSPGPSTAPQSARPENGGRSGGASGSTARGGSGGHSSHPSHPISKSKPKHANSGQGPGARGRGNSAASNGNGH